MGRLTIVLAVFLALGGAGLAQSQVSPNAVTDLYERLRTVRLDSSRVYQLRGASLERPGIHITLENGTIAFTEDVLGRVTGAFFEGDGEVLIVPPDRAERASLALFTNAAILEERILSAYFRFNDNTRAELEPFLRPAEDAPAFIARWSTPARNLAESDGIRLLTTFCNFMPGSSAKTAVLDDQMLHARIQGRDLGVFDVFYDTRTAERVSVAKLAFSEGIGYYDVWTSFNPRPRTARPEILTPQDDFNVAHYTIRAHVDPPQTLQAEALLDGEVLRGGGRTLLFELSRYLPVTRVEADGRPLEFIHNPALEGSQLARRGNDLMVVVFPKALETGEKLHLGFSYGGEVLSEQGKGLLYVGARGTWYPNLGLRMAQFDLTFSYPAGWTLLATGKRVPMSAGASGSTVGAGEQQSRWVSERPIPLAGFNLGQYEEAFAQADHVRVETYATVGVEHSFPQVAPDPGPHPLMPQPLPPTLALRPSPARNAQAVADRTAAAVKFFAERMGPFPYSSLAMTQLPGPLSQGWPGLVFLSSYAFLSPAEASRLGLDPLETVMQTQTPAHETAHQWWGDLISWRSYRDQWISEGLANYLSLMLLESKDPIAFREVMDRYRRALLQKDKNDVPLSEAGPVTLGIRLSSSKFPGGYEAISYGRGTWLFHMLRHMLRDAEMNSPGHSSSDPATDPFIRGLRKAREKFEGKPISTRELLDVFAAELPRSLWYEDKKSLDWFFDSWVQGTAVPEITLKNVKITRKQTGAVITGILVQKSSPRDLVTSVPLYAVRPGKAQQLLGRVFADGDENAFRLNAPADTQQIVIDPEQTLLRGNP